MTASQQYDTHWLRRRSILRLSLSVSGEIDFRTNVNAIMTKNLETADTLVKLILAISTIILYITRIISGPFAVVLLILSIAIILLHVVRVLFRKTFTSRK